MHEKRKLKEQCSLSTSCPLDELSSSTNCPSTNRRISTCSGQSTRASMLAARMQRNSKTKTVRPWKEDPFSRRTTLVQCNRLFRSVDDDALIALLPRSQCLLATDWPALSCTLLSARLPSVSIWPSLVWTHQGSVALHNERTRKRAACLQMQNGLPEFRTLFWPVKKGRGF